MRRTLVFIAALAAVAAQAQNKPDWPQPIVKGNVVVWSDDKGMEAALGSFQLLARSDNKIFVVARDASTARDKWKSVARASIVSSLRAEEVASASAVWIETDVSADAIAAVVKLKESGGTVGISSALLSQHKYAELLPYVGFAFAGDDHANLSNLVVEIDPASVLVVQGRDLSARGEGGATFSIVVEKGRGATKVRVQGRERADLIALRRRVIEEGLPEFPGKAAKTPDVKSGTLFIVGGGGMPQGLLEKFIEAAGGPDAPIVYVPCEAAEVIATEPSFVRSLKNAGAKNVTWIHTKDRALADKDDKFLAPLKDAKGVWFGGGRQWNLVDSYMDTQAHELMRAVLQRGGAIGGSSAGASIQAEFLARGDPLGNVAIIAPGYLRGLGFLPGAAVDQHFTQRGRHKDMTSLMLAYPQLLGIGIDEATAIIVRRTTAEVDGRGQVFFYDYAKGKPSGDTDYTPLKAGEKYDLAKRAKIG
jgi:cyanophycinase